MVKIDIKNNNTIPLKYHLLFWSIYFVFNVVRWGSYFDDYWYSLKSNLVEFPLHIIIVYFNLYYLIPKLITNKKYKEYVFHLILSLAILYLVRTGLNYFLVSKDIWPEADTTQKAFTFNHIIAVILGELYVIALATAIKLTVDWVQEKGRYEKLSAVQLQTELNFLKTQIQPHFFFNTLNNLYALALEKSKETPDVILKLSEMMEYILYEAKEPKIRFLREVKYIENYIELEKLRYGNRVTVAMSLQGDFENVYIPPLLFLPLIENCFKHGIRENKHLHIDISFEKTTTHKLHFMVKNNFNVFALKTKKHGIGNENINRRMELLFGQEYTLNSKIEKQNYIVQLEIPL